MGIRSLALLVINIVLSPYHFWDAVVNARKKNCLFDEYLCLGVDTTGIVTRVVTRVYRSGFVETHRIYKIDFAYRAPGTSSMYTKAGIDVPCQPSSRFIRLKVLPEHPKSGYPAVALQRNAFTNLWALLYFPLMVAFTMPFLSVIMALFHDDHGECKRSDDFCEWAAFITFPIIFGLMHLFGYYAAASAYKNWEFRMLESYVPGLSQTIRSGTTEQRSRTPARQGDYSAVPLNETIPSAEVVSILGQDGWEENHGGGTNAPDVENGVRAVPIAVTATAEAVVIGNQPEISIYKASERDPKSQILQQAMEKGDWERLRDYFFELRVDACEKLFYIGVVTSWLEDESWKKTSAETYSSTEDEFSPVLDAWLSAEPNNPDCLLVRGVALTRFAWHVRTAKLARDVDEKAWPKFFQRLESASKELKLATELNPSDAVGYSALITVAMGQKGRNETQVLSLQQAIRSSNDPHNLDAHIRTLQFLCQKWGGSNAQMFAFARRATKDLPEGDPLWILLLQAHFEMRLYISLAARQSRDHNALIAYLAYWKSPNVRQEVLHSYHQYVGSASFEVPTTPAKLSVLMSARNWYAYCLMQSGDHDLARREFHAIGSRPSERPWSYFGDPIKEYQEACNKLGIVF